MRVFFWAALLLPLLSAATEAKVITKTVNYESGGKPMEGFLAMPEHVTGKVPGVLVVHEWTGLGDYVKGRAEQLAELGYIAFAADIYGKGVRPAAAEAGKVAGLYKGNRPLLRERAQSALAQLEKVPGVDPSHLAAIGYCFGGTTVLELARAGAPLAGTVSFHGDLATPTPADAKNIRGKVLVLHGADDPNVPPAQVAAFEDEMRKGGVDWELTKYSKAVHAFTNKAAGNDPSKGAAYNAEADRRSWQAMKDFFHEIFGA